MLVAFVVAFFALRTWHWSQVLVVLGIVSVDCRLLLSVGRDAAD